MSKLCLRSSSKLTNYSLRSCYNPAMETIYIDSLFLLNLVIDYLLLLVSARVCGVVLKRRRYALAALIGALYAVGIYVPGLEWLSFPAVKLCLWLIMALAAFGGEEGVLRCGVVFAAVSAAFGGFIWALQLAGGRPAFDMRTLVLSFVLCYGLLRLVFGGKARLAEQKRIPVKLSFLGRECELMALVDTGNQLRDPISGKPVMVVSPHALSHLFAEHNALLDMDGVDMLRCADSIEELRGKFRLIPYSSVGGSGLLCAFQPDKAAAGERELEIMAAISKNAAGDGFQAII